MTFCLNSTIIRPENNLEIKNAIILLHGYGGDGKDISMLSLNWKRHLPNTIFICPDGHETSPINPSGFQWFDLTKNDSNYILDEMIKTRLPILLSTGMMSFKEIIKMHRKLNSKSIKHAIFQCTSNYPVKLQNTGLNIIKQFRNKLNCQIGYSDHSGSIAPPLMALTLN